MKPPSCLFPVPTGKTAYVTCGGPAVWVAYYSTDPAFDDLYRHFRCAEHRPPPGMFTRVLPYAHEDEDPGVFEDEPADPGPFDLDDCFDD